MAQTGYLCITRCPRPRGAEGIPAGHNGRIAAAPATAPAASDAATDIRPDVAPPALDGDHERCAHIVYPKDKITEASVLGTPVIALCGKVWVPNRDPERFPVCTGCIEAFEALMGRPWPGRR